MASRRLLGPLVLTASDPEEIDLTVPGSIWLVSDPAEVRFFESPAEPHYCIELWGDWRWI